jgi:hypothetical protein
MPGSGNNGTVRTLVTGCSVRSGDVYRRYVSGLCRQALLTLGDSALAVRVVSDVIADECALAPARGRGEDDVRHRLAESVFRRCQQLASDPGRRDCRPVPPPGDVAGRVGPGGFLSEQERGRSGLCLSAVSGTSGPAECWESVRVTWRPSCARHCSGWQPHRPPLPKQQRNRRKVMQKLGYVTAITMAAAGAALGVMAVRSLPDVRRYMAIKKM